ncbi:MAG: 50S ribosomal protein L10 [Candidatus Taylorbacteria bacterium]|nr:50S ribosomal protein L10 [Candidatus Taylorbacteria bacterium]
MARTKVQKKEIIEKLDTIVNGANSLVFVNIHGLKVSDMTVMRRRLKSQKVGFFIAKKTLSAKVLTDKKYEGTLPELVGEFGLAYGEDLIMPAREVFEFQKKFKDRMSIVGGVFDKKFMGKAEMTEIASIPPRDTLLGMFVNVINSPIHGFVMALDQISKRQPV